MRIAPDLPPPIIIDKDNLGVKALARIKPVKPVQARTLPPLVTEQHSRLETPSDLTEPQEKRHDTHVHGERRTYCRRIEHLPILVELRSVTDRRRHKQRGDDETEHVDEEI
ncbi:MAG: hypothetical protein Q7S46_03410 [Gallionella sp.]|nr:hypothetical protein [Gallionella sp.]